MALSLDDLIEDELGVGDLVIALGRSLGLEHAQHDLSAYWKLRLQLLGQALGLPPEWPDDRQIGPIFKRLAQEATRPGVLAGIIEYDPRNGVGDVIAAHATKIAEAEAIVRQRVVSMAVDLIINRWPELESKTVPIATLVNLGLPAEVPDPIDYL